jgi:gingipain R
MKKIIYVLSSLIIIASNAFAQTNLRIIKDDEKSTIVEIKFDAIDLKNNDIIKTIPVDGCSQWMQKGAPNLPRYTFSLQIPNTRDGIISIIDKQFTSIPNINILPSKGKISRTDDIDKIPLAYGLPYQTNALFPQQIAMTNTPYIIRDIRGQVIHVAPIQYNPITKEVIAYNSITLEINYTGTSKQNILEKNELPSSVNETFFELYANQFVNFAGSPNQKKKTRYTPILVNDNLLIICPQKFLNVIAPFIEWKKMKGIYTTVVNADTISGGINQPNIFNTVKYYYNTKNISHLLLIGNETDIPILDGPTIFGNGSDNPYGYLAGGDHYAEVITGRFTADNAQEITNQITKTIAYEKTPNLSNKWFSRCVGIASTEGDSSADDYQKDYEHIRIISDSLVNQGPFDEKLEFYDGNQGDKDEVGNPTAFTVIDSMNTFGISCINYAGHGTMNGIITSQFSSNEIPLLHNNNGKWPFIIIVGCSPGYFLSPNKCWAENLAQRTDSTGKQIGASISAMSTVNQWWDAPMEAQDEFNNILCGARTFAIKHSFAGMLTNGFYSMNDEYDLPLPSTDSLGGSEMTDTWQIFGDPTMVVKTNDMGAITSNYSVGIPMHATTYSMACNVNGADVCLYYKNEILATTKVIGGIASFNFPAGVHDSLAEIWITATKYNYTPLIGKATVANYPLQIKDALLQSKINVYPNPSSDVIYIQSESTINAIQIVNINGAMVKIIDAQKAKQVNCQLKDLATGEYLLKIMTEDGIVLKKVLKK